MSDIEADGILRVSASSPVANVASAIAHAIYDHRKVVVRAIGAGSVNQAVKAIAVARGFAAPKGYDLVCVPAFQTIDGRDGDISAIVFTVSAK